MNEWIETEIDFEHRTLKQTEYDYCGLNKQQEILSIESATKYS